MKTILLTGGSGFVGSNVLPFLEEKYNVLAPTRAELDVRSMESLEKYIARNKFDVIIHLASPSPVRSAQCDSYERLFEDCLKIFMNLYTIRDFCEKIIYSGSGAEYDKRQDIINASEEEIGKNIPIDDYGRAKFIMNEMARSSNNIYNLRIFGCYGPKEYDSKFITHAIKCGLENEKITIRQDCYFDYLYVDDYARYLEYCIENQLRYHDYNASSGTRIRLSTIAQKVKEQLGLKQEIVINRPGLNKEYTASNERIISEMNFKGNLISIDEGIEKLIRWEKSKR